MASKWKDLTLKEKFFEALDEGKDQWQGEETIDAFKESVDELLRKSGVALEDTRTAAGLQLSANNETLFKQTVAGIYCARPKNRREFKEKLQNEIKYRETKGNQGKTINDNKEEAEEEAKKIKTAAKEIREAVGNIQSQQIGKKVEEVKKEREVAETAINSAKKEAKQSISKVKNLSNNIKKRKTKGKRGRWALIAVLLVFFAVVCALSIAGAFFDENKIEEMNDIEKSLLGSGIAGALVDVIGAVLSIVFFIYEKRTDKKEGVSAKAISQQLDDIQTCIDGIQADRTKLDDLSNAVQTMSEKVEGIGGKAANIVATSTHISNIVNQISNVSQTIINQTNNYAAPEKEIVEKPIEVCPRCSVPLLPCPTCGWNGDVNSGVPNSQYWSKATAYNERTRTYKINTEEVILDEYSIGVGDGEEAEVEVLVFGPNVRKIKLSGNDDRDADGRVICNIAKANALFDKIRMVCFAEREEEGYCELGRGIFDNMASDITFMGLQYVKTIGDYCFGGVNDGFESNLNQTCQSQLVDCPEWKSNRPRRTY